MFQNTHYAALFVFCLLVLGHGVKAETTAENGTGAAYDFYVSPDGADSNPGTLKKPFATIDRARLAVRELKKTKHSHITVGIRGGRYYHRTTTIFALADSGSSTQRISYEAITGEVPVLTSEVPVSGWTRVSEPAKGTPVSSQKQIWSAPLPKGLGRIKYLYHGEKVLFRSMSPGFLPPRHSRTWKGRESHDRQYMKLPEETGIVDWSNIQDMELCILPTCDWTMYNLPLESIDLDTMEVKAAFESSYALGRTRWGNTPTTWFANCPEGMLEPGNWYVNTRECEIYLVSKDEPKGITAPSLLEYIKVEGEILPDANEDKLVENIHFKGLVFTHGKRDTWDEDHFRKNLQHEWERYDEGNALLRLRNTKNCSVTGCRFEHSGAAAIRLDLSSQHNRIEGNWIKRMGGTGIVLAGYGVGFKNTSFKNIIRGNHIHHVGEAYYHASAIILSQSEANRIANNYIHHTPYNGISITGMRDLTPTCLESGRTALIDVREVFGKDDELWSKNATVINSLSPEKYAKRWSVRFNVLHSRNNVIEYNEIHDAVSVLGDGNGYYMSGCGRNNTFRCNYVHHQFGHHAAALARTDGFTHYANFYNNVFYKCRSKKGGLVMKYVGNQAVNNFFVDAALKFNSGPNNDMVVKNNIIFDSTGTYSGKIVNRRPAGMLLPVQLEKIEFSGNIFDGKDMTFDVGKSKEESLKRAGFRGFAHKKITAISIVNDRVQINVNDPLFEQGYEAIDMSNIGIPKEYPREWLKYEESIPALRLFGGH